MGRQTRQAYLSWNFVICAQVLMLEPVLRYSGNLLCCRYDDRDNGG